MLYIFEPFTPTSSPNSPPSTPIIGGGISSLSRQTSDKITLGNAQMINIAIELEHEQ